MKLAILTFIYIVFIRRLLVSFRAEFQAGVQRTMMNMGAVGTLTAKNENNNEMLCIPGKS